MPKFQKYEYSIVTAPVRSSAASVTPVEVIHEKGDYVVHRNSDARALADARWVVTHKPTCLAAWRMRYKTDAIELCNRLGELPTIDDPNGLSFVGTFDELETKSAYPISGRKIYKLSDTEHFHLRKKLAENHPPKEVLDEAIAITIKFREELDERNRQEREAKG